MNNSSRGWHSTALAIDLRRWQGRGVVVAISGGSDSVGLCACCTRGRRNAPLSCSWPICTTGFAALRRMMTRRLFRTLRSRLDCHAT